MVKCPMNAFAFLLRCQVLQALFVKLASGLETGHQVLLEVAANMKRCIRTWACKQAKRA